MYIRSRLIEMAYVDWFEILDTANPRAIRMFDGGRSVLSVISCGLSNTLTQGALLL